MRNFLFDEGDVGYAGMSCMDAAIATDDEADGESQNPAVTLRKAGVSHGDRVIHFELPVVIPDGLRIIVE